ncbi:MAG: diguanylate cyclase [Fibromonadaceae bacterium]|jgi:diguanylate cyclase (GGDEF)-like protein|nr:diguanylate cyclase [Fibromonadaceae bacterium]
MRELIETKEKLCTGCNRCIRECPLELANITYLDDHGDIKVKVDHKKCVMCGRCIAVCKHGARHYEDDTERFFDDLSKGIPISIMAAPAIRSNIPEYKRLFTYLKECGVNKIYDVSLGADICTWAHIRYIEKNGELPMITQPCPAIVTYCQIYHHELLDRLSPVHSPMACTSVFMKKYEGIKDRIAAISPCVAKAVEFEETGVAQYNVTFKKLLEYMENKGIASGDKETDFDHYESSIGSLYPMPGGLKENIEFYTGEKFNISKSEGFHVYKNLNAYAETPRDQLPDIFDVLNCQDGCNYGTASLHDKTVFEINNAMKKARESAKNNRDKEYFEELFKKYDETFDITHFLRKYHPIDSVVPNITEGNIESAYMLLDKTNYEKQHIDCGACGSETCYGMARKVALNVNIPINCMAKVRDDAQELASKDPLTNAFNRRSFLELSYGQIDRMNRANAKGYICIFDLDYFKKINDTYGHLAGDKVLQEISLRVKEAIRPYDLLGRYGGEEFILFVFEIDDEAIFDAIDRIRLKICTSPVIFEDKEIWVSSSFGVASALNVDMNTAIKRADDALYKAKEAGRNKVVLHGVETKK